MSHWFATEKERQLHLLKQRHMHSILLYNLQSVEMKREQKQQERRRDTQHDALNCEMVQEGEKTQWERKQKQRRQQRLSLKAAYEQQLRVHQIQKEKEQMQKVAYAQLEKQYIEYEENKRLQELTRQFQRPTFRVTPAQTHRRVFTEPNLSPEPLHSPNSPHPLPQPSPPPTRIPEFIKLLPVRMEQQQPAKQNRSASTPRLLTEPPIQPSPGHYHKPRRASLLPPIN